MAEDNQADYSTVNYDTVVENCLSDDVRTTIPESWGKKFAGKSMNDVFKSHLSTDKEISRRVRVPDDETSDEDRRKFHTACGCPETADGYEFELPDDHDKEFVQWARDMFHKTGVNKRKAASLVKEFGSYSATRAAGAAAAKEAADKKAKTDAVNKAETELRATEGWGGEGYETNVLLGRKAFEGIYSDETRELLAAAGLNDHPSVVRDMHAHAVRMGEGIFRKGDTADTKQTEEQRLKNKYPDTTQQTR